MAFCGHGSRNGFFVHNLMHIGYLYISVTGVEAIDNIYTHIIYCFILKCPTASLANTQAMEAE